MSRMPEDSAMSVSMELKNRLIEIIADEDCESGRCNNMEFARRVGVNKGVISNITKYGIVPSMKSLIKIADYLNVSLEYLLGMTDNDNFEKSEKPSTFSERLLQLKEEKHLRFVDISNKMSFSHNSMHIWMKRNNLPSLEYLLELAKFFKVSPDYLLGRTDFRTNY